MASPKPKSVGQYRIPAQKAAALVRKEAKEVRLTDKQRELVHSMCFDGNSRKNAAEAVGMTDKGAREALMKQHVLAYLNECMEVLRTGLRPRALHTMGELLDDKNSSVKFKAAEYLDGQNRGTHTIGAATQVNVQVNQTVNVTPGYVIDLTEGSARQIEHLGQHGHNALPDQADVPDDE